MSASAIASREGFVFENAVYDELKTHFTDGFTLRNEREVRDEYGSSVSGIDIELFNITPFLPNSAKGIFTNEHIFTDSYGPISLNILNKELAEPILTWKYGKNWKVKIHPKLFERFLPDAEFKKLRRFV